MRQWKTISADSHINEPPDMFERMPDNLKDVRPKLVSVERGDAWVMAPGLPPRLVSTSAVAGKKFEEYMKEPVTYANMRPGSFDPKARIEDMEIDGVEAEVLFPGIMRDVGKVVPEARLEACKAYNDWMAEFCNHDRDRLIGLAVLAVDDGDGAVEEMRRVRKLGLRSSVLFQGTDGKSLNHEDVDRLWAQAEELDMPINLHIGTSALHGRGTALSLHGTVSDNAKQPGSQEAGLSTVQMGIATDLSAMIFGGVFDRHPKLKVVAAEGAIGWIPYWLDRMESVYDRHRFYLNSALKRRPTEVFHEHCFATFQEDHPGIRLRDLIGVDNIMWAADYPHTDTTWPYSQKVIQEHFGSLPEEERHKMVAGNAAKLYQLG